MADGIKIRALNQTTLIDDTDVLIIDKADAFGDSSLTYYITYADIKSDLFTGDITIDGNLTVNNGLTVGGDSTFEGRVTFESRVDVNGTIQVENINVSNNANINLDQLLDVDVSNAQPDDYLMYNGTNWVVGQPSGGGGGEPSGGGQLDYVMFNTSAEPVVFKVTVGDKTPANHLFGIGSDKCYYLNGVEAPNLILGSNRTYVFDQSDISNVGLPLNFFEEKSIDVPDLEPYTLGVTKTGTVGIDGKTQIKFTVGEFVFLPGYIDDETNATLNYHADVGRSQANNHMGNTVHFSNVTLQDSKRLSVTVTALQSRLENLETHVGNLLELE